MRYQDYVEELNALLEKRRQISVGWYGMIPKPGCEDEYIRMTAEAEEIRKRMRRLRYGEEG